MPLSPKLLSALAVIRDLRDKGFDAYLVGGFVRDYCIFSFRSSAEAGDFFDAADSYDIDIASSAEPSQIELFFPGAVPSGLKYGTMTILDSNYRFEHTTFRKDKSYPAGSRKPEVSYSKTLEEDVLRRDFKMNALALTCELELIDLVGGKNDIEQGLISTVGNPAERFREDSLRKLRALRFVSALGFDLAEDIRAALREDGSLLGTSAERIRIEFTKILMGDYVYKALSYMRDLGMFEAFVPEIVPTIGFQQHSKYHDFTVFEHIMRAVSHAVKDEDIRTAAFFHDIAKPLKFTLSDDGYGHFKGHAKEGAVLVRPVLERLKYPVKSMESIVSLIENHHSLPELEWKAIRRFVHRLGLCQAIKQAELALADNSSKKIDQTNLDYFYDLRLMVEEVGRRNWPLSISDLNINGFDIMNELKLCEGERCMLGSILDKLLEACLDEPDLNCKERLLELSREIYLSLREEGSRGF